MKKFFALLLALAMVLSLAACAASTPASGDGGSAQSGAPAAAAPAADSGAASGGESASADANPYKTSSGWPEKAITLICPYSAGGSSDLGSRYTAQALQDVLGVPVVVENVPGASGWLGWEQLLSSAPDGYTFALVNASTVTGQYSDVDPKDKNENDFCYLAGQVMEPMALIAMADDDRYDNWDEFIAYAQSVGTMIFPSNGLAKLNPHAAFIDFMRIYYDVTVDPVSVDSSKDNELMLQSGDVDFAVIALADVAASVQNGTYKILTIFSDDVYETFPDAPLIEDCSGINFPLTTPRGYAFPLGVDQEIIDAMEAALKAAITSDECVANMASMNTATTYKTGAEFKEALVYEVNFRRQLCGDI